MLVIALACYLISRESIIINMSDKYANWSQEIHDDLKIISEEGLPCFDYDELCRIHEDFKLQASESNRVYELFTEFHKPDHESKVERINYQKTEDSDTLIEFSALNLDELTVRLVIREYTNLSIASTMIPEILKSELSNWPNHAGQIFNTHVDINTHILNYSYRKSQVDDAKLRLALTIDLKTNQYLKGSHALEYDIGNGKHTEVRIDDYLQKSDTGDQHIQTYIQLQHTSNNRQLIDAYYVLGMKCMDGQYEYTDLTCKAAFSQVYEQSLAVSNSIPAPIYLKAESQIFPDFIKAARYDMMHNYPECPELDKVVKRLYILTQNVTDSKLALKGSKIKIISESLESDWINQKIRSVQTNCDRIPTVFGLRLDGFGSSIISEPGCMTTYIGNFYNGGFVKGKVNMMKSHLKQDFNEYVIREPIQESTIETPDGNLFQGIYDSNSSTIIGSWRKGKVDSLLNQDMKGSLEKILLSDLWKPYRYELPMCYSRLLLNSTITYKSMKLTPIFMQDSREMPPTMMKFSFKPIALSQKLTEAAIKATISAFRYF